MHQYEVWTKDLTPMMRPLSKLTEPITVEGYNDGKPFVPIFQLHQEANSQKMFISDRKFLYDRDLVITHNSKFIKSSGVKGREYWDYLEIILNNTTGIEAMVYQSYTKTNNYEERYGINQFKLYQLLFKWHFNVFNLSPEQFVEIEELL